MNRRERRGLYSGARAAAINTTVISNAVSSGETNAKGSERREQQAGAEMTSKELTGTDNKVLLPLSRMQLSLTMSKKITQIPKEEPEFPQ